MSRIYTLADINNAIEKIEKAGDIVVTKKTHAIYTKLTTSFTDEHYPLEIVVSDNLPKDTDLMIIERDTK